MTLKEAAAALEVSEKTVSRYAASGRLPQRYVKGKTGRQLDFDEGEIARLKEEVATPVERATVVDGQAEQGQTRQQTALSVLAPSAPVDAQIGALAQLVRAVMDNGQGQTRQADTVAVADRLTLDLDGAAALSGISRAAIRNAIAARELSGRKIGRGWRVERAALEEWVKALFSAQGVDGSKGP